MRYEMSTTTSAEPARLWAVLSDVETWPEWIEVYEEVRRTGSGELMLGDTVHVKQKGLAGVVVAQVAPGSRAYTNNLQAGDLIAQVNGADVHDLAALQAALAAKPQRLQFTLLRGQMVGTLSLQ